MPDNVDFIQEQQAELVSLKASVCAGMRRY
ncbi:hypothetical protein JRT77AECX_JRT77AEC_01210 [Escherichia coli]|nr:hypothetical protein JRT77AECX_JRT77AEC_01210 [Escherichia coli]